MLFAVDSDKDFIDVEGVAVASVLSLESPGIFGSELDAPKAAGFVADNEYVRFVV